MNIFKSLYKSFKIALASDEEIQNIQLKFPRSLSFLKRRLDKTKFSGYKVTVLVAFFVFVMFLLVGAINSFVTLDSIVQADVRVNNLLYVFRNASAVKFFIWITLLGQTPTVVIFTLVAVILLWLTKKNWQILGLLISIVGGETFTYIAKWIFQRPRPVGAVILESTNSFPSGHATIAVALYGFFAYLWLKRTKRKFHRILIVILTFIVVGAIGFSRMYLGVHYVSDVWTGYLVGLLWLVIGIWLTELKLFKLPIELNVQKIVIKKTQILFYSLMIFVFVFYIFYGLSFKPKFLPKLPITIARTTQNMAKIFSDYELTRYSETLTGDFQEPINFIISTKDDQSLIASFSKAGWTLADQVDIKSSLKILKYSISNTDFPTAPMTPSFWNKQVHDFGFEKSTETKSARQRHHARFWKTNLKTSQGETIYVGTVSLDIGIKWLITHKISPDIDTERDLLFADLQNTGNVLNYEKIKLVDPVLGENFGGDQFFTNGEAYLLKM